MSVALRIPFQEHQMIRLTTASLTSDRGTTKSYLLAGFASVILDMAASDFKPVAAKGDAPAHYHGRKGGVNVHLHGGLTPDSIGRNVGRLEVKVRTTTNQVANGKGDLQYYSINLYPTTTAPTHQVFPTYNSGAIQGGETWGSDQNNSFVVVKPL